MWWSYRSTTGLVSILLYFLDKWELYLSIAILWVVGMVQILVRFVWGAFVREIWHIPHRRFRWSSIFLLRILQKLHFKKLKVSVLLREQPGKGWIIQDRKLNWCSRLINLASNYRQPKVLCSLTIIMFGASIKTGRNVIPALATIYQSFGETNFVPASWRKYQVHQYVLLSTCS